jgi:hypothetical protein
MHYRRWWRAENFDHNKQYVATYYREKRKLILQSQLKPIEKQCLRCEAVFYKTGMNQKFCTVKCRSKAAYLKHREQIIQEKALYYERNKSKINAQKTIYKRKRRGDVSYRLIENLRSRLYRALKKDHKSGSAVNDLGCSIRQLKKHLEAQFKPGMSWDNYGEWHIDHIKPLISFNLSDKKELKKACHYANLQPLWAKDNILKGCK